MEWKTIEGTVVTSPAENGQTLVTLYPNNLKNPHPHQSCRTYHPDEIGIYLDNGVTFAQLCDTISRHEDPNEVQGIIRRQLFAYTKPEQFRGTRILDFGCGTGASSIFMAELLPDATVTGIDLDQTRIQVGRSIALHRRIGNLAFLSSPSGQLLPPSLGLFDYIMLSAVYEHLLPIERLNLSPQIWALLKPEGVLFINQTPHRWVPYEHHSTSLWGINYLPDRAALWYARTCSRVNPTINRSLDWEAHLRGGLRGSTERAIVADLVSKSETGGEILQPTVGGYRNRADYWLAGTSKRFHRTKLCIALLFQICDLFFDSIPALNVDVAIRKVKRRPSR